MTKVHFHSPRVVPVGLILILIPTESILSSVGGLPRVSLAPLSLLFDRDIYLTI
jgi:hypothetical protein